MTAFLTVALLSAYLLVFVFAYGVVRLLEHLIAGGRPGPAEYRWLVLSVLVAFVFVVILWVPR